MDVTGTCLLPQQADDKLRQHIPGWDPPHAREDCKFFVRVVLNQMQWFILVTFKDHIPKSEVYELGDSRHTLSLHCWRYIRIMYEDVQMFLNKSEWSDLLELARTCVDRQILKLFRLHEDLIVWRNEFYESNSHCTPSDRNIIDFETLYAEIMLHAC